MRRRLTYREIMLILVLLILVIISAYYLWFYVPVKEEQASLEAQIEDMQELLEVDQARLTRMRAMEKELEEIFAENPDPVAMALYDNSQNVMFELNAILSQADYYSLNFSTVDTGQEDGVVRRNISMQFDCSGYDKAKEILRLLHDNPNRCMFDNLSISLSQTVNRGTGAFLWLEDDDYWDDYDNISLEDATVNVSGTIVFFEYQER